MDDLEKEILNYKDMSTSINKIRNNETDFINRELKYSEREQFSDSHNKSKDCDSTECKIKKQNFNVDSFVKDLEINLDNFDNIKENEGPLPSNINFKKKEKETKKIQKIENFEEDDTEEEFEDIKISWKQVIYSFLIEVKEPIIIILIFILLNHTDLIRSIAKIPYFNRIPTNYPSLILRGSVLASIVYLLRKYKSI
jgi:hypothetical protein